MKPNTSLSRALVALFPCLLLWLPASADTVVWTNDSGGNWNVAANWTPARVPGTADTAVITNAGTYTVTLNIGPTISGLVLGGSAGTQTLAINGYVLTLNGPSSVGSNAIVNLNNGTLAGTGEFLVEGALSWSGGTISSVGGVRSKGSLLLNGANHKYVRGGVLRNEGTASWTQGSFYVDGGGVLSNQFGATFDMALDGTLSQSSGGGFIYNAGLWRKSAGTNVATFGVPFVNSGTLEVQSGTLLCNVALSQAGTVTVANGALLRLAAGGTATGPFETAAGGLVDWTGGYTLNSGAQLNGDGLYRINSSASVAVDGDVPARNLDLQGTLDGTNTLTVTGVMNWKSGTMKGGGRTLIAPGATLNLVNTDTVTAYPRTLENGGTVIGSGTGDLRCGSAILTNRSTRIWDLRGSQSLTYVGGGSSPRFDNAGLFRKSQDISTNSVFAFVNHPGGTVDVQSGGLQVNAAFNQFGTVSVANGALLRLAAGGTATGPFVTAAGGLVDWTGGYTLNSGAQLNGDGLYRISAYSVAVDGDVPARNLDLQGALDGTNTLTVTGVMNWKSGTMKGGGRTLIAPGATLNLVNTDNVTAYPRTLENGGTVIGLGTGDLRCGSAILTNRSTRIWDLRGSQSLTYAGGGFSPRFDNAGLFRKSQDTGTNTVFAFVNHPGGTVDVQSGGLQVNAAFNQFGTVSVATGALLRLAAVGTATGPFETAAGGLVDWTGGLYTLNSGAQLNGDGLYQINSSASVAVDGDVPARNLDLQGTLDGTNTLTVTGVMNWKSGTMKGGGRTLIAPGATLNLVNTGDVTAYPRTLENGGTVIGSGTGDLRCGSAILTNRATRIWDLRGSQSLTYAGGGFSPRFDNAGLFRKSQDTGTNTVFAFVNHPGGTVDVQSGGLQVNAAFNQFGTVSVATGALLRLAAGGTATGPFETAAGGLVDWTGGLYTLNSGAQLNGDGLYRISAYSVAVDGDVPARNLDLQGGLDGTNTLTVTGVMNWRSGTMQGGGRTLIAHGATLNLVNAGYLTAYPRTLENGGTVIGLGTGDLRCGSAILTNRSTGVWDLHTDQSLTGAGGGFNPRFDNAGLFRKSQGAGTSTVFAFANHPGGTISLWQGALSFNSSLSLSGAGTLEFGLAGIDYPANYGRILTSPQLQLNGCLVVTFRNGYLPGAGQHYDIISGPNLGTFQCYSAPLISPNIFINPAYQANLVQLLTTDPTPTMSKLKFDTQKRFTMEIKGIASQNYLVIASTNLQEWIPLQTNTMPATTLWNFVDVDSAALPLRFYRAMFVP